MNRKTKIVVSVAGILIVTLFLIGLTYAYFLTRINGNSNDKSITLITTNLRVDYQDDTNQVITGTGVIPGTKFTKTFSIKNSGKETASFSIILDNIVNPFIRLGDWIYKLEKDNTEIASGMISSQETQVIKSYETVTSTNNYTLTIEYIEAGEDQSIDMSKSISLRVNIANSIGDNLVNAPSGTLLNAIGRDNNITTPLTIPGYKGSGLGHPIELINNLEKTTSIYYSYRNYYWTYGDGYEFDEATKSYNLTGVHTCKYSECYTNLVGKYLVSNSDYSNGNSTDVAKTTTGLSMIYQIVSTTSSSFTYKTYNSSFKEIKEAELSYTEDDYGTSYYYRGNVENNYVNFGGMCWRIVRVQGDGSIKLTLADRNNECDSNSYSSLNIDSAFIVPSVENQGFIYRTPEIYESMSVDYYKFNTSPIAQVLDSWLNGGNYTYYKYSDADYNYTPIEASFPNSNIDITKLVNSQWCNDVTIGVKDDYNTTFDVYERLYNKTGNAKLKCNSIGLFSSTIGVLTADEVVFAGNSYGYGEHSNSYLASNTTGSYWTMSPAYTQDDGHMMTVSGSTLYDNVIFQYGMSPLAIRPVVVVSKNISISSGNGTQENPYVIN